MLRNFAAFNAFGLVEFASAQKLGELGTDAEQVGAGCVHDGGRITAVCVYTVRHAAENLCKIGGRVLVIILVAVESVIFKNGAIQTNVGGRRAILPTNCIDTAAAALTSGETGSGVLVLQVV